MLRIAIAALFAACTQPTAGLVHEVDGDVLSGSLTQDGTTVSYEAWSRGAEQASLRLDVDGMMIDVDIDLQEGVMLQDGHDDALRDVDTSLLLALRDAVGEQHPEAMDTLPGELLLRHTDRLAEAPRGLVVSARETGLDLAPELLRSGNTCGDNGLTCLPGVNGTANASYDPAGGSCITVTATYGKNHPWCRGRCGAGCPGWWFSDDDYTQDCFDHDMCVDQLNAGNFFWDTDCGDEFWEADDDYFATYVDACPD